MRLTLMAFAVVACAACGGTTVLAPLAQPPTVNAQPGDSAAAADGGGEPTGPKLVCDKVIDDFASLAVGAHPSNWQPRDDDTAELAKRVYTVADGEDGKRVLHAVWQEKTVTIGLPVPDWDMDAYPILSWRWKAVKLPEGADESVSDKNDTGAAVYASWKVGFPMFVRGIKYAWSSSLAIGTRTSKRMKHDQMLVVESGRENLGQWRTVRVDVRDHARKFFEDDEIAPPDGIAIMTDADSTKTAAEAYFADFRLCHFVE
jgi:Protein of unknown function (DUF3047)